MLETDYLIIGSGAVGMAFADILLTETNANIIIVDRYQKPGGHWNLAYPFVTLHQPSAFYGVSSSELSKGIKDQIGLNKGLNDLASGAEVSAYFDDVMRHQFLPSGRVQYFPLCEYKGDYKFTAILTGKSYEVKVNKKIVDATFLKPTIPSTHTPNFQIAPDIQFIPINDLPKIKKPPTGYVVIGSGKTGIDACLWLLEHNVDPDKITWIMPRDAWMIDRKNAQVTEEFFEDTVGAQASQLESIANATSVVDLFDRLEAAGVLLRIDKNVTPSMFHAASISQLELEQLRRLKNIVRKGRVTAITKDQIILVEGVVDTNPDQIYIDCSASALTHFETKPIFNGNLITPQTVRAYMPAFSAAFIAHIEAAYTDEMEKNELCTVAPIPNHDFDWVRTMAVSILNQYKWNQDEDLRKWLYENRLDPISQLIAHVDKKDIQKQMIIKRIQDNAKPAIINLQQLMGELVS